MKTKAGPNIAVRWLIFVWERFNPLAHIPWVLFFWLANGAVAVYTRRAGSAKLASLVAVFCMFLHLRIFDEIKDYTSDKTVHPERPLARGLISVRQARMASAVLILTELAIALRIGLPAFISCVCVVLYSLLMYREFFISSWLRPRLATYAVTHTLVSCWISLFVYSSLTGSYFWTAPAKYRWFVLANWMVFNIYEFGRKTFGKEEEKELVDSYSKRLGPWRAAFNVVLMAAVATVAVFKLGLHPHGFQPEFVVAELMTLYYGLFLSLFAIITLSAILYAATNRRFSGRIFRTVCSFFILCFNAFIVFCLLFTSLEISP